MQIQSERAAIRYISPSIFLAILFLIFTSAGLAVSGESATFTWQDNPPEDNVVGYRLYFGNSSRLAANGSVKVGFQYQYYIDLTEDVICYGPNFNQCERISYEQLTNSYMATSSTSCTLHNLSGQYYFALTAYNEEAESPYTHEISKFFGPKMTNLTFLQAVNKLILEQ